MTMNSRQKLIEVERRLSHRPRYKAIFLENKMRVSDTVKFYFADFVWKNVGEYTQIDRVPISVSEWLNGSFSWYSLWCWWVFLLYQLSYLQRVGRQCCQTPKTETPTLPEILFSKGYQVSVVKNIFRPKVLFSQKFLGKCPKSEYGRWGSLNLENFHSKKIVRVCGRSHFTDKTWCANQKAFELCQPLYTQRKGPHSQFLLCLFCYMNLQFVP